MGRKGESMTLDEAIKHCEEVAKEKDEQAWEAQLQEEYGMIKSCKECAEEHRQLAEWLRDYKRLKEQEPCEDAISRGVFEQVRGERDIAIEQLHELGYELGQKIELCEDAISKQTIKEQMIKYGFHAPDMTVTEFVEDLPPVKPQEPKWIPVSERLPKTDNENSINSFNVLLWVKNKTHPEREPQIYLGKLRHVDGDDGSRNFWGIETKPCEWTIWGWSYFNEPEVIAWMPLPESYKGE
jgi:hypothetical protein